MGANIFAPFLFLHMTTRRNFIKTVILGSGTVYLSWKDIHAQGRVATNRVHTSSQDFRTAHQYLRDGKVPPQLSRQESHDYVIIGGGAAGIAAAWQLKKAGKDFILLENEPALGGVMQNPAPIWKGHAYPLGSTYFARYDGVYAEFLTDLDVHPIETGEDVFCFPKGELIVDPWNPAVIADLPIPREERESFRSFRDFILALPIPTYPLVRASKEALGEYDPMPASEFVRKFRSPVLTDMMDLYSRSVLGAPLAEVNAYSFLNFYSIEFGDAFKLPCYTLPGGLGIIAEAGERFLGAMHIAPHSLVVSVEEVKNAVETRYVDTRTGEMCVIKSKAAIIATPKNVASRIVRGLPTEQSKAMASLRYTPYITIALCSNAPLFEKRAFDYWVRDKARRFTDILDVTSSQDAAAGKLNRSGDFVYMLSSPRSAEEFKGIDSASIDGHLASIAQKTMEAVAQHIPGAREKIVEMHVYAWGHSLVVPAVGSYAALAPKIAAPHGNIHFAHSDNDIAPGYENAVWWGAETAKRIL